MKKPIVSIVQNENITHAVHSALNKLELPNLNGKTILLKPNVGREVEPNLAINTNPEVVAAVFDYLKKKYSARFLIGDSPIINTNTEKAFSQSGYSSLLAQEDLEFVDLDGIKSKVQEIPNAKLLKSIKITGYWDEIDAIVSIPCLKMHMHCGASLSFKNLKGLIYKRNKTKLHHLQASQLIEKFQIEMNKVKELDVAISDLAQIFKPVLAVIDASYVQEGMGPSSGNAIKLNTIISSTNYLAADIIALAITQPNWTLRDVPHLKLISDLLGGPKERNEIKTIPNDISKFVHPIEPPPKSITIKYENVRLISEKACSACLSTIFNLLKNNQDFIDEHFSPENPLNLAIGKGIKKIDLYEDTFLIGNCTAAQQDHGVFIKGCTPVESQILKQIKDYFSFHDD